LGTPIIIVSGLGRKLRVLKKKLRKNMSKRKGLF